MTPWLRPILEVRRPGQALSRSPRASCSRSTIGAVKAVDGVSFDLRPGRDARHGRRVRLRQVDPGPAADAPGAADRRARSSTRARTSPSCPGAALRRLRRNIQMVFQDPYTSLNPRMTVGDIIGEPFEIHPEVAPQGRAGASKVQDLLDLVGPQPGAHQPLPAPVLRRPAPAHRHRPRRSPCNPEIIVCDEPVSALDVSVQAQVINLLEQLQDELGLSYIFIAHDLSVVRHISDRVGGDVPRPDRRDRHRGRDLRRARRTRTPRRCCRRCRCPTRRCASSASGSSLTGDVPSPANPPSGCRFRTRCWKAQDICAEQEPAAGDPSGLATTRAPATSRRSARSSPPTRREPPGLTAHRPPAGVHPTPAGGRASAPPRPRARRRGGPRARLLQRAAAGAEQQQGELGAVGAEGLAEPLQDLPFPGEHQPGAAGGHPGSPDLLGQRGPLLPQLDQRCGRSRRSAPGCRRSAPRPPSRRSRSGRPAGRRRRLRPAVAGRPAGLVLVAGPGLCQLPLCSTTSAIIAVPLGRRARCPDPGTEKPRAPGARGFS